MTLHSFGCSFVFGTELEEQHGPVPEASGLAWPAVLSRRLGYDYKCHAWPASGNLQIAEKVLNTKFLPNDTAIVVWSFIDRKDLRDYPYPWHTVTPTTQSDAAKIYFKNLHSQYCDQLLSLMQVQCVIRYLQTNSVTFAMTTVDDLLFDQTWNLEPAMSYLVNETRPYFFDFQGQSFLSWCRDQGHQFGLHGHPLCEAHTRAAEYVEHHWQGILNRCK